MKKFLRPTGLCLAITLTCVSPVRAGGIPVIDAAGLANALQMLVQLQEQIKMATSIYNNAVTQLNQLKTTDGRLQSALQLAGVFQSEFGDLLPEELGDLLSNQNIDALKSLYKLADSTGSENIQKQLDNAMKATQMLKTLYDGASSRAKNIDKLREMQNSVGDAAEKADYGNRIAAEQLELNNQQVQIQLAKEVADREAKLEKASLETQFMNSFWK
ncbi:type IV secretion system protein [Klebsiella oxytoca]|uniref:type IV secretion system protein n=1 Tax=Klebsiella oxytoca TaxID=571 RepID=UPI00254C3BF7|nr:type IV secretion system protein [Klebsiella oxytoca]MEC5509934.1 type IV secretion system protein [Klebsiella oxytoca]